MEDSNMAQDEKWLAIEKPFGRRRLLTSAAGLGGGAAAGLLPAGCSTPNAGAGIGATTLVATDATTADTTAGKVRGFSRNGIHTFKGIPYAGTTGGAARFLPPTRPQPWTGIRSAMWYGPTCPQGPRTGWLNDENAFLFQWDDGQPGEDCLRVNIWTPGLNDGQKRPVMVWLHGGLQPGAAGLQRRESQPARRRRRGQPESPAQHPRLLEPGCLRGEVRQLDECGRSGSGGGTGVGEGQHRQLRRRSRQCADLWAIRRGRQGEHPDVHAHGQGAVPQGGGRERLDAAPRRSGTRREAGGGRGRGTGLEQGEHRQDTDHAIRPLARGADRGPEEAPAEPAIRRPRNADPARSDAAPWLQPGGGRQDRYPPSI